MHIVTRDSSNLTFKILQLTQSIFKLSYIKPEVDLELESS